MTFATPIATSTAITTATAIPIPIPTDIYISIAIEYLLFAIDIYTPIVIGIPTDISIDIVIDYLLFNTTLTYYNWKIRKIERLCASNIASVNALEARVLAIERDTTKTVRSERDVTPSIVSTIKKKQNLWEDQHIEDSDTVLKEVTCLRSAIKSSNITTVEAIRTINCEHTSRSFDEKRQLNRKHSKAIFDKHSFITKFRWVFKYSTVNAQ